MDKKRFPAYATDRVSALEDISIYTYDEDAPLKEILTAIYKKENGKECPSHKEDLKVLQKYIIDILPNYDKERVYSSDIKKLFQWYNLLLSTGNLVIEEVVEEAIPEKKAATKAKKETSTEEKKTATKKAPVKPKAASADKAKSAKPAASKKVSAVKTGSSRGK